MRDYSAIAQYILKTLAYFDIFRYPLKKEELKNRLPITCSDAVFEYVLKTLSAHRKIYEYRGFWLYSEKPDLVERRIHGNKMASETLPKAKKIAQRIGRFPFVEAVFVSGSLSKDYMDAKSDIDFFIITTPSRLWTCRTLLTLFKKVFLLNQKKHFCINYFIDTQHLEIPDKNQFTATEINFLLPLYGKKTCAAFFDANSWVRSYYHQPGYLRTTTAPLVKKTLQLKTENWLHRPIFDGLENWCLRMTQEYRKRKFKKQLSQQFEVNMRSKEGVSKHHPTGFQFKVMKAFEERCEAIDQASLDALFSPGNTYETSYSKK